MTPEPHATMLRLGRLGAFWRGRARATDNGARAAEYERIAESVERGEPLSPIRHLMPMCGGDA